jgi:hypothetical protein
MMLALVFGTLGMALMERADRSVRGAGEVRELTGAPVLAALVAGRDGGLQLTPSERKALAGVGSAGERLLLAPVGDSAPAEALAHLLEEAPALAWSATGRWEDALPAAAPRPRAVEVGPEPVSYAAAAELVAGAGAGGEIVLVIRHGRTSRDALRRAEGLLREAGGVVAGVVVIAGTERERDAVWR